MHAVHVFPLPFANTGTSFIPGVVVLARKVAPRFFFFWFFLALLASALNSILYLTTLLTPPHHSTTHEPTNPGLEPNGYSDRGTSVIATAPTALI